MPAHADIMHLAIAPGVRRTITVIHGALSASVHLRPDLCLRVLAGKAALVVSSAEAPHVRCAITSADLAGRARFICQFARWPWFAVRADAPPVHRAQPAGFRIPVAVIYGARFLRLPGPRLKTALRVPPGVVATAPAARHYIPVAPFHAAYFRVLFHTLEYNRKLGTLHHAEGIRCRDIGTYPPEHKPSCLARWQDPTAALDEGIVDHTDPHAIDHQELAEVPEDHQQ